MPSVTVERFEHPGILNIVPDVQKNSDKVCLPLRSSYRYHNDELAKGEKSRGADRHLWLAKLMYM